MAVEELHSWHTDVSVLVVYNRPHTTSCDGADRHEVQYLADDGLDLAADPVSGWWSRWRPATLGAEGCMKRLNWLCAFGLVACIGPGSATVGTSTGPTADTGTASDTDTDTDTDSGTDTDSDSDSDTDTGVASGAWDAVPCEAALADCLAASTMVGARTDDYRETTYDSCGLWSDLVKFEPGSTGVIYASHAVRGGQGHLLREETDNGGDGSVERVTRREYDATGQLLSIRTDGNGDGIDEEVQAFTWVDGLMVEDLATIGQVTYRETHIYDTDGVLLTTTTDINDDGRINLRTTYVYDGDDLIREDADIGDNGSIDTVIRYTWVDGLLMEEAHEIPTIPEFWGDVVYRYTYDSEGRQVQVAQDDDANGTDDLVTGTVWTCP